MNFFKALFGGKEESPEDKRKAEEARNFDVLKYDGVRALRSGRPDYAIRCFTHALRIRDDLEIRDYLSQAFVRADMLPEAFDCLLKISDARPGNANVYVRMASVAYMMEDYAAMADACEKAISVDGSNAEAAYLYAKACMGLGDRHKALALLARALELEPGYAEARLLRGEVLLGGGDYAGADVDACALLGEYPESDDVLMLKARVERAKGDCAKAVSYYNKVVDINPFHAAAYKERGELRVAMGDEDGGNGDMRHAAELAGAQSVDGTGEGLAGNVAGTGVPANPFGL